MDNIIRSIRSFFYTRGFREIEIPIFHTSLPLEPNIYACKVGKYYLPTSPEATLKKAIAKGGGNCFAIGHTFRDLEGSGKYHKPEFLMLEWYRENANYSDIMREVRELIQFIVTSITPLSSRVKRSDLYKFLEVASPSARNDMIISWPRISMENLFMKYAKISLTDITSEFTIVNSYRINSKSKLASMVQKKGYKVDANTTWENLFNQIFLNEIEKHLPKEPFFLIDYPAKISPLCARRQDKPYLAQRFELYINGIEIANGNTENTDAEGVLKAMKDEEKFRRKRGLICPPIDMEFIDALAKMQDKSYAGIGLGIERLTMILGGIRDIKLLY